MNILEQVLMVSKRVFNDADLQAVMKLNQIKNYDSMNFIQLIIDLEEQFEIQIKDDDLEHDMSFENIADFIEVKLQDSVK